MNIVSISNITVNLFGDRTLKGKILLDEKDTMSVCVSYGEVADYASLLEFTYIIVICLNFNMLYLDASMNFLFGYTITDVIIDDCIKRCNKPYSYIKSRVSAHIIWFEFEDYFRQQNCVCGNTFDGMLDQINLRLYKILESDTFIDLQRLIASVGISKVYGNGAKYRLNEPYSKQLIFAISSEVFNSYR